MARTAEPSGRSRPTTPPTSHARRRAAAAGGLAAHHRHPAPRAPSPAWSAGLRALAALNQRDGFDCPGCAWPEPARSTARDFEFCENGAKAVAAEATRARADAALLRRATASPSWPRAVGPLAGRSRAA